MTATCGEADACLDDTVIDAQVDINFIVPGLSLTSSSLQTRGGSKCQKVRLVLVTGDHEQRQDESQQDRSSSHQVIYQATACYMSCRSTIKMIMSLCMQKGGGGGVGGGY